MFPLSIRGFVKAYAGIRAQITNSVAHLLFESSVLKTKVACGHVQWNDNSVKLETRSQERGEKKQLSLQKCFYVSTMMLHHYTGCEKQEYGQTI